MLHKLGTSPQPHALFIHTEDIPSFDAARHYVMKQPRNILASELDEAYTPSFCAQF
jgi:hypothetical protein